ncbi:MAG TPA: hypothetical protein VML95_05740 [Longimicrobiales bacterium]|nr:hypothetical protein [Longimicrobiales bacterium]
MPHLSPEEIARLVDETPSPAEAGHLGACADCTDALADLRRQTAALAALPPIDPPARAWSRLEARLREEGILAAPAPGRARFGVAGRGGWMAAAAVVSAFLVGGASGFALRGTPAQSGEDTLPRVSTSPPESLASPSSVEDAEGEVRVAETRYLNALEQYNRMLGPRAGTGAHPWAARFAALESIVASARAALHEAPYDPVINGYYINASAQRDAMIRQISTEDADPWY